VTWCWWWLRLDGASGLFGGWGCVDVIMLKTSQACHVLPERSLQP
jgi:hypothetical protein